MLSIKQDIDLFPSPSPSLSEPSPKHPSLSSPQHPSLSLSSPQHPSLSLSSAQHPSLSLSSPQHPSLSLSSPEHPSLSAPQLPFLSLHLPPPSSLSLSSYLSQPLYQSQGKPSVSLPHPLPFPLAHLSALRALTAQHQLADMQVCMHFSLLHKVCTIK
jgi:hypothetical protein